MKMSLRSVNEIQMEIRGKLAARPAKLPIYHLRPREKEKKSHLQNAEEATDVRFRAKIQSYFVSLLASCSLSIV